MSNDTYVVYMNGDKVRSFNNILVARAWATKHCRGEVKIVVLDERKDKDIIHSARSHWNEDFCNFGAYKYNPLTTD